MAINHKFHRLHVIESFLQNTARARRDLMQELIGMATDDTRFMRRFRMLADLAAFESQAIKKIWNLQTEDPNDYIDGYQQLTDELRLTIDRSA